MFRGFSYYLSGFTVSGLDRNKSVFPGNSADESNAKSMPCSSLLNNLKLYYEMEFTKCFSLGCNDVCGNGVA
jgi:hypothetical protein